MKKNLKLSLINILIFTIYYTFPYILDHILEILNIDFSNSSAFVIILFLVFIELIPLGFLIYVYRKELKEEFKIYKNNFNVIFDKQIRYWIVALMLMSISNVIIGIFTGSEISNNEEAVRDIASILPLYSAFTSCICAPLGEELAYRKSIGKIFNNKKISIIMSGLIFGLAHVIGTYTGITDLLYVIPYGLFGSVFMYLYLDTKTIWSTITVHFLHNALLLIMFFIR